MNETTDKELFNLPENYEELYGLNHITFEIPYDLFKKILKESGHRLSAEDYMKVKIHPSIRTNKTVGQCSFLFSAWMNDNLKQAKSKTQK